MEHAAEPSYARSAERPFFDRNALIAELLGASTSVIWRETVPSVSVRCRTQPISSGATSSTSRAKKLRFAGRKPSTLLVEQSYALSLRPPEIGQAVGH